MNIYKTMIGTMIALSALTGCNNGVNQRVNEYVSDKRYNGVSDSLTLTEEEMKNLKSEFRMYRYNSNLRKERGSHVKDGPPWDPYPQE